MRSDIDRIISEIKLKADKIGYSHSVDRARKGAYIDCICILKSLSGDDTFRADVVKLVNAIWYDEHKSIISQLADKVRTHLEGN